jgi:MFS family permease
VGPVAGGALIDTLSWRAIFFLNVPLATATIALALSSVPNSYKADARERLDWAGALSAAAGLAALTYGLTQRRRRMASRIRSYCARSAPACYCWPRLS